MNTVSDLRNNEQEIRTGSFDCCSVAGIGNRRTQELFRSKRYWTDPGDRDDGALMKRLKCKPGDKVPIYRRGEREYELEFLLMNFADRTCIKRNRQLLPHAAP